LSGIVDISFIIVSYNTADLIGECIGSVQAIADCVKEIIVVDNASTDSSADLIRRNFPSVRLIENDQNRGFAAANNQAIPLCRGRYIFFLNPDTRIESESLRPVLSFMDENPRIGLAGTRIINPDGSVQQSVEYRYPGQRYAKTELKGLKGPIAWVMGAGMIARSDVIRMAGGFDEDFFLYGEEQDLCLRIRKLGYEIGYCDSPVITHFGGQSERKTELPDLWKKKILSEYLFYRKHYHPGTIKKIARENLVQAKWRLATIKLFLPFFADKEKERNKYNKYKIVYETVKKIGG